MRGAVLDDLIRAVPEMDTSAPKIFFLLLLSVFRMTEVCSKNNKIKIIVPHKISIIHHHHSRAADLKPKKKFYFDVYDVLKSNRIHEEEESEEDASEEGRFGHYLGEADEEASQSGVAYYTFPTSTRSNAFRLYAKPAFLYKDSYERKRPPRYEYRRYEDYNYPEETYQESRHRVRGFQYR